MATLSATTLRTNNCQIMTKAFQVSATADAIMTYGRAKNCVPTGSVAKSCELLETPNSQAVGNQQPSPVRGRFND